MSILSFQIHFKISDTFLWIIFPKLDPSSSLGEFIASVNVSYMPWPHEHFNYYLQFLLKGTLHEIWRRTYVITNKIRVKLNKILKNLWHFSEPKFLTHLRLRLGKKIWGNLGLKKCPQIFIYSRLSYMTYVPRASNILMEKIWSLS